MSTVVAGRYVLREQLGEGGFGIVYRAGDLSPRGSQPAEVALKMLKADAPSGYAADSRLRREIRIGVKLEHPNLMPVLDHGVESGLEWYTMPLASGVLRLDAPLRPEQVLSVFEPVSNAISFLHENQTLHRDLSANNVLYVSDRWVVSDLGLAKSEVVPTSYETSYGISQLGTQAFVAPEQLADFSKATERSDIYSLGKILQYLSEGTWPVREPLVANRLRAIIQKASNFDPANRYSTAAEMLAAVRVILQAPPAAGTLGERVERISAQMSTTHTQHGLGLAWAQLAMELDPDDERQSAHLRSLLMHARQELFSSAFHSDLPLAREATQRTCRAVRTWSGELRFEHLDSIGRGLGAAAKASTDANARHALIATLAEVGAQYDRWSYRDQLVDILLRHTKGPLIGPTVSGLAEAGSADWVLQQSELDDFQPELRRHLAQLIR